MANLNQAMIPVTPEFIDGSLKFYELASHTVKRAMDELSWYRAMYKKAIDARAATLAHLVKAGVIPKGQEKQAEAMLADPVMTYQLLKNSVDKYVGAKQRNKQAGDLGRSVSETEAGLENGKEAYDSLNDPHVGRRTSEKKASDLAILAVLDAPK